MNKCRIVPHSNKYVIQCKSKTLKRQRCKKDTAKTKKCWIHLGKEDNLRIKPSTIPNARLGLFAYEHPFGCDQTLGVYTGRQVTQADLNRKYGRYLTVKYAICNSNEPSTTRSTL